MMSLIKLIKENKVSYLICIMVSVVVYLLLSLFFKGYSVYGLIMTPIISTIIYTVFKLSMEIRK